MSWLALIAAVIASLAVLYAPGYLLCRAASFARFAALATAPVFSVIVYVVLGVVLYEVHVSCPAWVLFLIGIAACALVFGVVRVVRARRAAADAAPLALGVPLELDAWKTAALYVGVSFVITLLVFIICIHNPDSFARNDDTSQHLSMIRGFLDTGTYSTLHVSPVLDLGVRGSFYPAAWHVTVAIVAAVFGNGVTLATNAMTIAFVVFVFPLGMALFFERVFGRKRAVVLAGGLFVVAFCGFPWGFLVWGQLFPNMMSWMFIPPAMVLLMEAVDTSELRRRIAFGAALFVALVSIAVAQPNGAFTFGIWAVFWGVNRFFYDPGQERATITRGRVIGAVLLFVVACAVWFGLFVSPPMHSYAVYTWAPKSSLPKAVIKGLLFMFSDRQGVQPVLSILVLLGVIYTCKNRRHLWMTVSFAVALIFFIIDYSMSGFAKQLLSCFWYTDANRTGAMAALFAIPLATLGFAWIAQGLCAWWSKRQGEGAGNAVHLAPVAALVAVLALGQFIPVTVNVGGTDMCLGLVKIHREVKSRYSPNNVYTTEEQAFVKRVMQEIPKGAMVINVPNDGSCYAYGVDGLNTYFRRSKTTGIGTTDESKLLRLKLKNVKKDKQVQQVLAKRNAHYLLFLDDVSGTDRTVTTYRYKKKQWTGIESITKKTPGFTLVLSEGDMRLYKIDY